MFAPDDTIVAVATAAGRGGIGIVRISGPLAPAIACGILDRQSPLEPRHATFARLRTPAERQATGDEVIATWFAAPRSYTGQHVVEISAHGSPVVLHGIVTAAVRAGARHARPGEFTLRAFLSGKRDLIQAEAVADLVDAATPLQARVAFDQLEGTLTRRIAEVDALLFDLIARLEASLDFPEEGYHFVEAGQVANEIRAVSSHLDELLDEASRGRLIREGATVVIAGRTNVGKSSLFNALAGSARAIVTDVPGTTRDLITERVDIGGLPVTLVDTAGARHTADVVEREGVERGAQARRVADLLVAVLDSSAPLEGDDLAVLSGTSQQTRLVVANKVDVARPAWSGGQAEMPDSVIEVSARTGEGLPQLRDEIVRALCGGEPLRDTPAISNARHATLLREARQHLEDAVSARDRDGAPEEFVLADLQAARGCLDEVVGVRTSDDVLAHIFERFCIGK